MSETSRPATKLSRAIGEVSKMEPDSRGPKPWGSTSVSGWEYGLSSRRCSAGETVCEGTRWPRTSAIFRTHIRPMTQSFNMTAR